MKSILTSGYEQIYNERGEIKTIPAQELVDKVKARIREIEAQIYKQKQIDKCRAYNLKKKAEKEKQILECRRFNLAQKAKKDIVKIKGLITGINLKGTVR